MNQKGEQLAELHSHHPWYFIETLYLVMFVFVMCVMSYSQMTSLTSVMTAVLGLLLLCLRGLRLCPGLYFLSLRSLSSLSPILSYTWSRGKDILSRGNKMGHLITVDNIAQPLEHGAPPFYQLLTKLNL